LIGQIVPLRNKITRIIKMESFHVTVDGRRDVEASKKRFLRTMVFRDKISDVLSKYRYLEKFKVEISEEPLMIVTS